MATIPIANRAKVFNLKASAHLQSPPNLLDLAIKKEKIITKQKALARRPDGNEKFPCLPYLP
ncbi:hypothetical protein MTsPCn5_12960 [Croceitalea sp. MTPC5]|uniref:hypothetical protein n=1 Tax=Croceitalea sp. MTPC5 TaxID=3056565 RepID=UPI002B3BA68A|nr:hypothetical protein MTsPCn5_12960 [Croceitalea sp. MTPC5]